MSKKRLKEIEEEFRARGFSCMMYHHRAGEEYLDFVHDETELTCLVAGFVRFQIAGVDVDIRRGELVTVPAATEHSLWVIEDSIIVYGYRTIS